MTKEEFDSLDDPRKTDWYSVIRRDAAGKLIVLHSTKLTRKK